MSYFLFQEPQEPTRFTIAGGEAGLGEIASSAYRAGQLADNTDAAQRAINEAYDNRIAAIRAATGEGLENPMNVAETQIKEKLFRQKQPEINPFAPPEWAVQGPPQPTAYDLEAAKFRDRLRDIQERYPQYADVIRADVPITDDANALRRQAEEDANLLAGSRPGVGGVGAQLIGGIGAGFTDPVNVGTMFLGGGVSTGRTVAAVILKTAFKEALINGAVEAATQPFVQASRAEAGLPSGFDQGVRNVLLATAGGAILGGAAEGVSVGFRRVTTGRWLDAAAEDIARAPTTSAEVRDGLRGNLGKIIEKLRPMRDRLEPEARAAMDVIDNDRAMPLPAQATPMVHDKNIARAAAAAERGDMAFEPVIDPARIDRITNLIAPNAPKTPKGQTDDLATFLMRAGGVQDQKGEITALGLQKQSRAFTGKLVRDDGMTLDHAREVAAESGFFDHRYGTPDEAVAKSTIADLLDELDAGARRAEQPTDDGGRAYAESRVSELLRLVGPEVDDRLVADAVNLAERENIPLIDAFDRVALDAEPVREASQPMDASDPLANPGFTEPDMPDETELFTPEDLDGIDPEIGIPFDEDNRMMTGSQIVADIEDTFGMFQLTVSCKV